MEIEAGMLKGRVSKYPNMKFGDADMVAKDAYFKAIGHLTSAIKVKGVRPTLLTA